MPVFDSATVLSNRTIPQSTLNTQMIIGNDLLVQRPPRVLRKMHAQTLLRGAPML
jgi:hypothetical protein